MQGIGLVRLLGERAAVARFGVCEAAGLVCGEPLLKQGRDVYDGHREHHRRQMFR